MIKLAQDLHRRMGYPLGKAHYQMQQFVGKMNGFGSPMRHVRRIANRTKNIKEVMARKTAGGNFTRNVAPAVAAHAQELDRDGFTYFTDQVDPQLLAELTKYYDDVVSKRSEAAHATASHPFFFPLDDPNDYTTDHILVRFALQDSILQALTSYFGCVPFLNAINIMESRSVKTESNTPQASQQWHLDYSACGEDEVRVWVHFTDVDTVAQGPFTFLPISGSRKVKNDIFPRRIKDEEIEAFGLSDEVRRATGPRSTTFMINTLKCYHMGSRLAEGQKRVVCMYSYVRPGKDKNFIKMTAPVPKEKELVICR